MSRKKKGTLQNELLTVTEVADYFRVSHVTVWRWCKRGTLPAFRIGRNWRVRREALQSYLDASNSPGSEPGQFDSTFQIDLDDDIG